MGKKPLEGIKVADFTWALVGPMSTKHLSDNGAEVIKIEGKSKIDVHRIQGPYQDDIPGLDRSNRFNWYTTGKLSIALNIARPKGIEVAKKIVAWADIVVDNFAGGTMERMGLGYEELKKMKPDIIMLSSSMQGQTGPYSTHRAFGLHLTALTGFNHISGWPDRQPAGLMFYTDYIAPHFNILAILAALSYRRRTGKGQYIDVSQSESCLQFMAPLILDYTVNRRIANRMGNHSAYATPHGVYQCRGEDRWCAIAVFTDEEWDSFCRVIGNPSWTDDPKFASIRSRKENEEELEKRVEEWTIDRTAEEVMSLMQTAGVSAGVVQTTEDLLEHDPQLRNRHFFWDLEHPEVGTHRSARPPYVLSKSTYELQRAPLIGEHNEYVLKEVLHMSDEEIAELTVEGVIE